MNDSRHKYHTGRDLDPEQAEYECEKNRRSQQGGNRNRDQKWECVLLHAGMDLQSTTCYGVAMVSRTDKITGLFCRI